MGTEFTDNNKADGEGLEGLTAALSDGPEGRLLSSNVVQPLRLLEARISDVQSRWHAVEEQLTQKDRAIAELRTDLAARAAIIKRLEETLADSIVARESADDANAASQAELSHLEAQLVQQTDMLSAYQQKLSAATAQYTSLQQQLESAHEEIGALRAELTEHQATLAANAEIGSGMPAGEVHADSAAKDFEGYIKDSERDRSVQTARLLEYADSLDELEGRLQEQEALLGEREAAVSRLGIQNSRLESLCADKEATILTQDQKLSLRIGELESARADTTRLHTQLEDLQSTVAAQIDRIESLETDLAQRDSAISSLEAALETESRLSAELASHLEQQAQRVVAAEARLAEKVDAAQSLETQLDGLRERVTTAEAQLADRSAKVDSLERTLANTTKALKAATHNLDRATADADTLREELGEARGLTVELENEVAAGRMDRQVFEAELGAQQLLVAELERDLEKQQRTVALLDSSVERITTIAASLASLDQQMAVADDPDFRGHQGIAEELSGPCPALVSNTGTFSLDKPVLTIGRSRKNDIQLQSLFTSRFHARILVHPSGKVTIEDLASRNGIRVNAERVNRRTLEHEDKIWIGERELTFLEPAGASDTLRD